MSNDETPVELAKEVVVGDDNMTPNDRFAAARMLYGKDKTASYKAAFPDTTLMGKSLYNAAAAFAQKPEVTDVMKNMEEFSRGRLTMMTGNFIEYVDRHHLRPIMESAEKDDAEIAEMSDEELRAALRTSIRQVAILNEELAGSGKKSVFTANLAVVERLSGIIRNIGDVLADKTNKVLILNMPPLNAGSGDGRIWHNAPIPTSKGEWNFDTESKQPVHRGSFQLGIQHATKKYGGGKLRCPGALAFGCSTDECYQDRAAGGDGHGGKGGNDGRT